MTGRKIKCTDFRFRSFHALIIVLFFFLFCSCQNRSIRTFMATDFTEANGFTPGVEGPASDAEGNIYAVNFAEQGTIGQVTPDGKASIFVRLPEGSIGNGIRFNAEGNLLIADYTMHNVLLIDKQTKQVSVYAHNDLMNQPNDLAIGKNQLLYLSDPNWKESTGQIWRVDRDGSIILLESDMGTTNGIEVSPDEKRLYVNESVQLKVWVYDLSDQGEISNKRLLIEFPDHGMDGMRCDIEGNLYITRYGKGTVAIVSPEGKLLNEITLIGKKPSNIAFGGKEGKTCYVTMADRGCLESFEVEVEGREWSWK